LRFLISGSPFCPFFDLVTFLVFSLLFGSAGGPGGGRPLLFCSILSLLFEIDFIILIYRIWQGARFGATMVWSWRSLGFMEYGRVDLSHGDVDW